MRFDDLIESETILRSEIQNAIDAAIEVSTEKEWLKCVRFFAKLFNCEVSQTNDWEVARNEIVSIARKKIR